jgi:hypothetical protein
VEIWIEDAAGQTQGDGPITTADDWEHTAGLDRAGSFSFKLPASDPRAALIVPKLRARAVVWEAGNRVELGYGIIDRTSLDVTNPAWLSVSGSDRLGELGGIAVGELNLSSLAARTPGLIQRISGGAGGDLTLPAADVELSPDWWLYIGDADTFEAYGVTLGTDKNTTEVEWQRQFFNVDTGNWESVSVARNGDGTVAGGKPFGQSGTCELDPPYGWGQHDGSHYIIRMRPVKGPVTLDIDAVTVSSWQPVTDALARLIELAPQTTTLAAVAHQTDSTITVVDDEEFADGDPISVLLDDNSLHSTTVDGTPAGNVITLAAAIPGANPATVAAAVANTVAGANGWHLTRGTNAHTSTAAGVYLSLNGQSLLTALIQIASTLGEHFKAGAGRRLVWMRQDQPSLGKQAVHGVDLVAVQGNDQVVLWTSLRRTLDAAGVYSRIYPRGGGTGDRRVGLEHATRSLPSGYAYIDQDSRHVGIKRTPTEDWAGRIDNARETWPDVTRRNDTALQREHASNALCDKAVEWLSQHSSPTAAETPAFLDLAVVKVGGVDLPVGYTLQVVAQQFRDDEQYVDIDAELHIVASTLKCSQNRVQAVLQVANVRRKRESDAAVTLRQIERSMANAAARPAQAGATSADTGVVTSVTVEDGALTTVNRITPLADGVHTIFQASSGGTDGKIVVSGGHLAGIVMGVQG